jgi:hypothetical protein
VARQSYGRLSLFMVVFAITASLVVSAPGRACRRAGAPGRANGADHRTVGFVAAAGRHYCFAIAG